MREYLLSIAAGLISFFPLVNQFVQAPAPSPQVPVIQKATVQLKKETKSIKRHRVNLQVISLSDLKIAEGSQVVQGQVLSDRTEERQSLEAERNQIQNSIQQLSIPTSKLTELPEPNFAIEEAAIQQIKDELKLMESNSVAPRPETSFRFKDETLRKLLEANKLEERAKAITAEANDRTKLAESKARLVGQLNSAIAALNKAKSNYQHQQYEHSLNLVRQQGEMQRQQYQIASLVGKKQEIEGKLREITQIKSPVSGRIRRIKNLGQKDRQINLEVVIDVIQTDRKPSN
jgi:hypothetical protein